MKVEIFQHLTLTDPMIPVHSDTGTEINRGQMGQAAIPDDNGPQPDTLLHHNEMPSENDNSHGVMSLSQSCQRPINTTQSGDVDIRARGGNDLTQFDTSLAPGARSSCVTGNRGPSADFPSHFPASIPQPEAADAWAADLLAYGGGFSHVPPADIPQPNAADAWAAGGVMGYDASSSHVLPADIPQPNAADAWAASGVIGYDGSSSHAPPADIPQPEAVDSWVADRVMEHTGGSLALPSSSNVGRNSRADPCIQARTPLLPRRCGVSAGAHHSETAVFSPSCTDSYAQDQEGLYQGNHVPLLV